MAAITEAWKEREKRADRRIARIIATLANAHSAKGKKFTEEDFIPKTEAERQADVMKKMLNLMNQKPEAFKKVKK